MSCDRCESIHLGQMLGQNTNPCRCECHGYSFHDRVTCTDDSTFLSSTTVCTSDGCTVLNLNNQ